MEFVQRIWDTLGETKEAEEEGSDENSDEEEEDYNDPITIIKYMWHHEIDDEFLKKNYKPEDFKKKLKICKLGKLNVSVLYFDNEISKRVFDYVIYHNIKNLRDPLIDNTNKYKSFTWIKVDDANELCISILNHIKGIKDEKKDVEIEIKEEK
jgi:hypothetical protein